MNQLIDIAGQKFGRVTAVRHDGFSAFLRDMGERPAGCVLSRKGDAGNYEPGNVEWKLRAENRREQRKRRAT